MSRFATDEISSTVAEDGDVAADIPSEANLDEDFGDVDSIVKAGGGDDLENVIHERGHGQGNDLEEEGPVEARCAVEDVSLEMGAVEDAVPLMVVKDQEDTGSVGVLAEDGTNVGSVGNAKEGRGESVNRETDDEDFDLHSLQAAIDLSMSESSPVPPKAPNSAHEGPDGSSASGTPRRTSPLVPSLAHDVARTHRGVECDGCGEAPLKGGRYWKRGENYDLCSRCFEKLLLADKNEAMAAYSFIDRPGATPGVPVDSEEYRTLARELIEEKVEEADHAPATMEEGDDKDADRVRLDADGTVWKPCFLKGVIRFSYTPRPEEKAKGAISVRPGDIVIIQERTASNEYYRGAVVIFSTTASYGMFPSNFVEVIAMMTEEQAMRAASMGGEESGSMRGVGGGEAGGPPESFEASNGRRCYLCMKRLCMCPGLLCLALGRCLRCCVLLEWYSADRCPCLFNIFSRPTWNALRNRVALYVTCLSPVVAFLVMLAMHAEGDFGAAVAGWDRLLMFSPMVLFFGGCFFLSLRSLTLSYDPQFFGGSIKVRRLFYAALWTFSGIMLTFVVLFVGAGAYPAPTVDDFAVETIPKQVDANGTMVAPARTVHSPVLLNEEYAGAIGRIMAPVFVIVALVWVLFCILSARLCLREASQNNSNVAVGIVVQVIACCLVGLLSTQGGLVVAKLQGVADYSWRVALTPIWILDSLCACATLTILGAVFKDDDLHNPAAANLYAIVGAWCFTFFPLFFTEILFCSWADFTPSPGHERMSAFAVISPFLAMWGFMFLVGLTDAFLVTFQHGLVCYQKCMQRRDKMRYVQKRLSARVLQGKDALDSNKVKTMTHALTGIVIMGGEEVETGSRKMTVEEQAADAAVTAEAKNDSPALPKLHAANASDYGAIDGLLMEAFQHRTSSGIDTAFREVLKIVRSNPEAFRDVRLHKSLIAFGEAYRTRMSGTFSEYSANGWNEKNASLFGELLRETSPIYVVPK